MAHTYCVVYRTGGTARYQWHRTMPYDSIEAARQSQAETQRMGYAAYVVDHRLSLAIGLPETFDADERLGVQ